MIISDNERREVARRLRGKKVECEERGYPWMCDDLILALGYDHDYEAGDEIFDRLADIIEPNYKPDPEYETWCNSLVGWAIERDEAKTVRELIKEIVWIALTVDLGPNGNRDPSTGIDEGAVYTDGLFSKWKRDVLRLTRGCDRDALLELADGLEKDADNIISAARNAQFTGSGPRMEEAKHDAYDWRQIASRIRKALGAQDA